LSSQDQDQQSRGFSGVWPKAGLALGIIVVGMGIGVALATFLPRGQADVASEPSAPPPECGNDAETLDVVADEAVVSIVQDMAAQYTADLEAQGRECIHIAVRPVTSSAVAGRLANGWREDTHGPRPDVWIPKSTLWVELLRAQIDDEEMLPDDPTVLARSPTVMALPQPMAVKLGWPEKRLSWGDFFDLADAEDGWGHVGEPTWGPFRLELTDPRYTTTGLQALLALTEPVPRAARAGEHRHQLRRDPRTVRDRCKAVDRPVCDAPRGARGVALQRDGGAVTDRLRRARR
jgi:Ca-activated chloride channel family protein